MIWPVFWRQPQDPSSDLSVFELFAPLTSGGRVILIENALALGRLDLAAEPDADQHSAVGHGGVVAAQKISPSIRTVNLAGEPLKASLVQADSTSKLPRGRSTISTARLKRRRTRLMHAELSAGSRNDWPPDSQHPGPHSRFLPQCRIGRRIRRALHRRSRFGARVSQPPRTDRGEICSHPLQ